MTDSIEVKTKKRVSPLKVVGICLLAIVALALIAVGAFLIIFRGEVRALTTLERVGETDAFTMEYVGDYGLDEFLEKGAVSDAEVVEFVSAHFLHGIPVEFELPDFACTAFGAQTPEGEHITGRNFDFYDTPILVLKTVPKNGYASVTTVDLEYLGFSADYMPSDAGLLDNALLMAAIYAPMDGINEAGLTISVLMISDEPTRQDTGKPGITTSTAIRMVLDKAASVDEALALLEQYDMCASAGSSYHFLLTDASGKHAVVEYIDDECYISEASLITNYLITPVEHSIEDKGVERYTIAAEALEACGGIMTQAEAMQLLSDARYFEEPDTFTQWSVVFNNSARTATYCFKTDYEATYVYEPGRAS